MSTFPTTLDSLSTSKVDDEAQINDHAPHHNAVAAAINQIEAVLQNAANGIFRAANGTSSAPTHSYTSETNSGVYRATTNDIRFSLAGSDLTGWNSTGFILSAGKSLGWGSSGVGSPDVLLSRESANILRLVNGTNAQALYIYGTYTNGSNYERLEIGHTGGTSGAYIRTAQTGSGSTRPLILSTTGAQEVQIGTNNAVVWRFGSTGNFFAAADGTYDIGAQTGNRPHRLYTYDGLYASQGSSPSTPVLNTQASTGGSLTGGQTYYYKVTGIDAGGNESSASPELSVAVTAGTNTNTVTLNLGGSTGYVSYRVYRGTTAGGESAYQTYTPSGVNWAGGTFMDTGAAGTAATPPAASSAYNIHWGLTQNWATSAPFTVGDGGPSAPGFAFAQEKSTGLYRSAAGQVSLSILGSERVRVGSAISGVPMFLAHNAGLGVDADPGTPVSGSVFVLTNTTSIGNGTGTNLQAPAVGTGGGPSSLTVVKWLKVYDGTTPRYIPMFV